jgi:hypothetical protein
MCLLVASAQWVPRPCYVLLMSTAVTGTLIKGRWYSDQMLHYLHLQAKPLMHQFSRKMLHSGNFTLLPNQLVPPY